MEGSKGPGPDASRKNSGDSGPVGEAIPVRIEEGPAGDGPVGEAIHRGLVPSPPPRPPEQVPQSRRGLRTVGDVGRAGLSVDCGTSPNMQQKLDEALSLDGFLWKLMLGLL